MSKVQHSFSDDFNKTDSSSSYDDRRSTFFDNESRYESVFSNQVRESFFSSCNSDEDTMDELISKKIPLPRESRARRMSIHAQIVDTVNKNLITADEIIRRKSIAPPSLIVDDGHGQSYDDNNIRSSAFKGIIF